MTLPTLSEKRWAAFGQTDAGRFLTIIFTKRGKLLRIISARDMNGKERTFYKKMDKQSPKFKNEDE